MQCTHPAAVPENPWEDTHQLIPTPSYLSGMIVWGIKSPPGWLRRLSFMKKTNSILSELRTKMCSASQKRWFCPSPSSLPWVLLPALESSAQQRYRPLGAGPEYVFNCFPEVVCVLKTSTLSVVYQPLLLQIYSWAYSSYLPESVIQRMGIILY